EVSCKLRKGHSNGIFARKPRFSIISFSALKMSTSTASSTATSSLAAAPAVEIVEHFRKNYQPCPYAIHTMDLDFNLDESDTLVTTKSLLRPQQLTRSSDNLGFDLVLDGEDIELVSAMIGSTVLARDTHFKTEQDKLIIFSSAITALANADQSFE